LVVIGIIGILAGGLTTLINPVAQFKKARDGIRKSDLRQIQSALELYRADKGSYPGTASFPTCGNQFDDGGIPAVVYIKKIPCDPSSSSSYEYSLNASGYCLRACLENVTDNDRDEIEWGTNNPSCGTLSSCASGTKSYTLQNP